LVCVSHYLFGLMTMIATAFETAPINRLNSWHSVPTQRSYAVERLPTVFIVDDDPNVARALDSTADVLGVSVMPCSSTRDFLERFDGSQPGCLIMEVRMPGISGLELQQLLIARKMTLPIIMISSRADVRMVVEVMSRGAVTFLEKPFRLDELVLHVRRALQIEATSRTARVKRAETAAQLAKLTRKEVEVLDLISAGKTNKQIASELHLSIRAIEDRRARLMRKLGIRSLAQLVQWRTEAF
jgi:FixJ family two-component response regulator